MIGPRVGDTRMYLIPGVLCYCAGVAAMMSKPCATCSPEVDALVQL